MSDYRKVNYKKMSDRELRNESWRVRDLYFEAQYRELYEKPRNGGALKYAAARCFHVARFLQARGIGQ